VASLLAAILTEIYLCNVCSCHELLRRSGLGQDTAPPPPMAMPQSARSAARPAYRGPAESVPYTQQLMQRRQASAARDANVAQQGNGSHFAQGMELPAPVAAATAG
jgi:hypothetical protein